MSSHLENMGKMTLSDWKGQRVQQKWGDQLLEPRLELLAMPLVQLPGRQPNFKLRRRMPRQKGQLGRNLPNVSQQPPLLEQLGPFAWWGTNKQRPGGCQDRRLEMSLNEDADKGLRGKTSRTQSEGGPATLDAWELWCCHFPDQIRLMPYDKMIQMRFPRWELRGGQAHLFRLSDKMALNAWHSWEAEISNASKANGKESHGLAEDKY